MKKLLIGTGLVVVLGVVGLVALPSLIPSSVYKEKIEAQLEKELARNVTVSGDVKPVSYTHLTLPTTPYV